jgi:RNA 3'-terminal phosphate cyclase-like protein
MNQRRSSSTSPSVANSKTLRFDDGAIQFRQRIVVSILSHRALLLRNIRSNNSCTDNDTLLFGLQAHEASFLRLIDQMTNGSHIEINASGTQLLFRPGILLGGSIQHDCPIDVIPTTSSATTTTQSASASTSATTTPSSTTINFVTTRSIGWYIEGILPLAPFGKEPLSISFTGITDGLCAHDPSCDYLRASALPILCRFLGLSSAKSSSSRSDQDRDPLDAHATPPTIRIGRRGAAPLGGGTASFYSPVVRSALVPLDLTDVGKFKRVRGTATTTKLVSSSLAARVAYACKGVLHQLLPDVWIHTDNYTVKQHGCGPSPSCTLLLTAESTTTGVTMSAEVCLDTLASSSRELPEDLGVRGAIALLEEIRRGGCVDTGVQSLVVLLMCLTPEDVSRVRIGTLSPYTIESLRLLKMAFGVEFKCQPDPETKTILLSCLGTGYKNMARAST